jgi:hypothetical protein
MWTRPKSPHSPAISPPRILPCSATNTRLPEDIKSETRKALDALHTDPEYRARYDRFVADMAYGERPGFSAAMQTVSDLASTARGIA